MPVLAAFIGGLISSLVAWLAKYVVKKLAVRLATIIALGAAWATLYAGVKLLFAGIALAMPSELVTAAQLIAPDGWIATLTAYMGAKLAIAGYRWFKEGEKIKAWL